MLLFGYLTLMVTMTFILPRFGKNLFAAVRDPGDRIVCIDVRVKIDRNSVFGKIMAVAADADPLGIITVLLFDR